MTSNEKHRLIFWCTLAVIITIFFTYKHIHQEHIATQQFQVKSQELENCISQQADTYLEQANRDNQAGSIDPYLASGYGQEAQQQLDEYNSAITQCKSEY